MKGIMNKLVLFFTRDIWRIRASDLSKWRFVALKYLRTFILAVRGFHTDSCSLRASALTFFTIMSIVPVVAMGFGIAKGFNMEDRLEKQIRSAFEGQEKATDMIVSFAKNMLEKAKGGVVAGIGVAVLLWTIIKVLGNIEKAFNHVWGITKHRSLMRKIRDYVWVLLVAPVLLILSNGVTVLASQFVTQLLELFERFEFLGFLGPVLIIALKVMPFLLLGAMFTFVYAFMPNTKVQLKSAIFAGVLAGVIFQILNWAYINFQVGVSKYSAVYGSFAALPLFLIWLQLSWLVVLFGAELSFAHQNVETYEFEPDCQAASSRFRRLIALRTAQCLVHNFTEGRPPMTAAELSHEFGAPIRLMNETLQRLVSGGVLSETSPGDSREIGYQPARAIDQITIAFVIDALDRQGTDDLPIAESKEFDKLATSLGTFDESMRQSPANVALKDI